MNAEYDIAGLITIVVNGPDKYLSYFENEYRRMSVGPRFDERTPSINRVRLDIVDEIPEGQHCRQIRYKNLFDFHYSIVGIDTDEPRIYFKRHWLEYLYLTPLGAFVQGQLLEPLMYLQLLRSNVLFMHCAGVASNGNAFLFPAHGGTGKTTMALDLMRRGFDLMGDDLLLVEAESGLVHPYPRPLHLFTYNLGTLDVPLALNFAIRFKDVIRRALRTLSGENFLISTRAHIDEIMEVRFAMPSTLKRLTFLRRDGKTEKLDLSDDQDFKNAATMILQSADLNESLFTNIVDRADIRALEKSVVHRVLKHVRYLHVINARSVERDNVHIALKESMQETA